MTKNITIDGINYVCQVAQNIPTESVSPIVKAFQIGLVIIITLLCLIGILYGLNKIKEVEDDEEDDEGKYYY